MSRFVIAIKPKTAFATPLVGDTLFGQACWAIRHSLGVSKLTELLEGYTNSKPFMVLSDAHPRGYLKRPCVPFIKLGMDEDNVQKKKAYKAKQWLPEGVLVKPIGQWGDSALTEAEMMHAMGLSGQLLFKYNQSHNSLNRKTGTTGSSSGFAPFNRHVFWYHPEMILTIQIELDESRFTQDELHAVFSQIGLEGFGKEASCGLGKFEVLNMLAGELSSPTQAKSWLTLAPCAPQQLPWNSEECYYQVFTRFGRHGGQAVHKTGGPFKKPVLMADSFAVLTPKVFDPTVGWVGQGLSNISITIPETVHQGYAPVIPVQLGGI
jgi:CRISPR-associated protein Csm4